MKGVLVIETKNIIATTEVIDTKNKVALYEKVGELKDRVNMKGESFIVYLQLPSKMNTPGFMEDESLY